MKRKKKKRLIAVGITVVVLAATFLGVWFGFGPFYKSIDRSDMMEAETFTASSGLELPYRIFIPASYNSANTYPLVVYLHGSGERGTDNTAQVKRNSIMQTLLKQENIQRYPCIIIAPQCPEDMSWGYTQEGLDDSQTLDAVMELIEKLRTHHSINKNKIYITGVSMGGYGTWSLISSNPNYFAAAIPVCGWGDTSKAGELVNLPIWAFHGAKDNVVLPESSRTMVKAIEKAGSSQIKYTEYPGIKHNSWEEAYREEDLFSWLFAQSK